MKKTAQICLSFILLFSFLQMNAYASEGDKVWMKNYGGSGDDAFYKADKTSDGGYVTAGYSNSNNGDLTGNNGLIDFVITKFDINGNKIWMKNYGGSGDDYLLSVKQTSDGGYITSGYSTSNNGDLTNNKGSYDFVIAKFDGNGNKIWMKNYGGSGDDKLRYIDQTSDGGYMATGNSRSNNGDVLANKGDQDIIIAKFDGNGDKVWIKNYGGSFSDTMTDAMLTLDGGIIIAGNTTSFDQDITGYKGGVDSILAKFDGNGNKVWIKSYGGTVDDFTTSVQQTADGGYVLAGYSNSDNGDIAENKGSYDAIITKFDGSGNRTWTKVFGGTIEDIFYNVRQTPDGNYIAIGQSKSINGDLSTNYGLYDFVVAKFDSVGKKIWGRNYGGNASDYLQSVLITNDIVVFGKSNSVNGDLPGNKGNYDAIIAKFLIALPSETSQMQMGLQAGTLSLIVPTVLSDFGTITLNGSIQTIHASTSALSVRDYTGNRAGYHITVQASQFSGTVPGNNLPTGSLQLSAPDSITLNGTSATPPSSQISSDTVVDRGPVVAMLSANANEGMGSFDINFAASNLTLTIPPSVKTDTYTTVVTWSIISGP